MTARTIVPRTHNVQRVGLRRDWVRVVTVRLFDNVAAKGGQPLHRAEGVTFDGAPVWWYVTHADARRFGWLS